MASRRRPRARVRAANQVNALRTGDGAAADLTFEAAAAAAPTRPIERVEQIKDGIAPPSLARA